MARIFNIYFEHEAVQYSALISMRTTPFFTEYMLGMMDENLMDRLPGNKIISTAPDHFLFPNAGPLHSRSLMNDIIRAVAGHLTAVQA